MYSQLQGILNLSFFGNSVFRYLLTIAVLMAGMLIIKLILRKIIRKIKILIDKLRAA